jgi:hypothetical protein
MLAGTKTPGSITPQPETIIPNTQRQNNKKQEGPDNFTAIRNEAAAAFGNDCTCGCLSFEDFSRLILSHVIAPVLSQDV